MSLQPVIARRLLYLLFLVFVGNSFFLHVRGIFLHDELSDISAFYTAAVLKSRGDHGMYESAAQNKVAQELGIRSQVFHYLYPPIWAEILSPMTALPFKHFQALWLVLDHLLFVVLLLLLRRVIPEHDRDAPGFLLATIAMLIAFSPIERNFQYGQVTLLLTVLLTIAVLIDKRRYWWLAGLCLGFSALLKVGPILLIGYLMLRRHWRAMWATIGSVALFVTLSIAVFGVEDWIIYVRDVLPQFGTQLWPVDMAATMTLETPNYSILNALYLGCLSIGWQPPNQYLILTHKAIVAGMIIGFGLFFLRYMKQLNGLIVFQLIVALMMLVTPILWPHHFVFLLPGYVFAMYLLYRGQLGTKDMVLLVASFAVVALMDYGPKLPLGPGSPLLLLKVVKLPGLIVYLWLMARLSLRRQPSLNDASSPGASPTC